MIYRLILTRVTPTSEILAFLPCHQSIPSPHPSEVGHDACEICFKDPASIGESLKTIHYIVSMTHPFPFFSAPNKKEKEWVMDTS